MDGRPLGSRIVESGGACAESMLEEGRELAVRMSSPGGRWLSSLCPHITLLLWIIGERGTHSEEGPASGPHLTCVEAAPQMVKLRRG